MLTVHERIVPGSVLRAGTSSSYRALQPAPGERHSLRTELTGPVGREIRALGKPLLVIGQMTDLHFTDVESPARFEFLNRFATDARFRELITMQRPQEALNAHSIAAMVRAMNAVDAAPVSGAPLELVLMTGDAIDNAQANELATYRAVFEGGMVSAGSGGPELESVQTPAWPDDIFWKPDGTSFGRDRFRTAHGFPLVPGLLDRAMRPFDSPGLKLPWFECLGNHEELCQGVGVVTPELARLMVGGRKPIGVPDGLDAATAVEDFVIRPHHFMSGPTVAVTPDERRRPADWRHRERYGVVDTKSVRIITLDTSCPAGGADGRIDGPQLAWLEARLTEAADRVVVIASHHPLFTLRNRRVPDVVDPDEVVRLVHRFPNVVLWLNGHVHLNMVQPHANPAGTSAGFWEVTTSSLVDWPCQSRVVELFDAGQGQLAIACTMLDHDGPADPGAALTPAEMAGLHRQLAFNDPIAGVVTTRAGTEADRNVVLTVPNPLVRHP